MGATGSYTWETYYAPRSRVTLRVAVGGRHIASTAAAAADVQYITAHIRPWFPQEVTWCVGRVWLVSIVRLALRPWRMCVRALLMASCSIITTQFLSTRTISASFCRQVDRIRGFFCPSFASFIFYTSDQARSRRWNGIHRTATTSSLHSRIILIYFWLH